MNIPSRESNPFATCWTGPPHMDYLAHPGVEPAELVARLESQGWRAQIVGPHGVGKSTLLGSLEPLVAAAGRDWRRANLYSDHRGSSLRELFHGQLNDATLLVIDGYEQLTAWSGWWIRRRARRAGAGLLVTTHTPVGLPTLVELQPNRAVAEAVFAHLVGEARTPVVEADLHDAFNACNGNLRDTLFKLYDLHERRTRAANVANRRPVRHVEVVPSAAL